MENKNIPGENTDRKNIRFTINYILDEEIKQASNLSNSSFSLADQNTKRLINDTKSRLVTNKIFLGCVYENQTENEIKNTISVLSRY
jgi:hypothetical protein